GQRAAGLRGRLCRRLCRGRRFGHVDRRRHRGGHECPGTRGRRFRRFQELTMTRHVAAAVSVLTLLGACSRSQTGAAGEPIVGSHEIPASITLTPHTILVRDGARAVRNISADGTTVTLSASSPGATDVKAGSVVLIRDVVVVKA